MNQYGGCEVMWFLVQALGFDAGFGIDIGAARRVVRRAPTGWRGAICRLVSRHSAWWCDMLLYVVFVCRKVTLKLGFANPNVLFCAF
jgi:hypothetical protein